MNAKGGVRVDSKSSLALPEGRTSRLEATKKDKLVHEAMQACYCDSVIDMSCLLEYSTCSYHYTKTHQRAHAILSFLCADTDQYLKVLAKA